MHYVQFYIINALFLYLLRLLLPFKMITLWYCYWQLNDKYTTVLNWSDTKYHVIVVKKKSVTKNAY